MERETHALVSWGPGTPALDRRLLPRGPQFPGGARVALGLEGLPEWGVGDLWLLRHERTGWTWL